MPERWPDAERPSWLAVLNVTVVALPVSEQAVIERPSPAATLTVMTEPFQADDETPSPAATLEVSKEPFVSMEPLAADDLAVIELPTGLAKWEIVTEIIPPWED